MKWALGLVLVLAFGGAAEALEQSKRPVARDATPTVSALAAEDLAILDADKRAFVTTPPATLAGFRPVARSERVAWAMGQNSLRPLVRPRTLEQKAMARKRKRAEGSVCGIPDIQGKVVGGVPGRIRGCGIPDAVRVREVAGVSLSQEALMDCNTAKALNTWVQRTAKPAFRDLGGLSGLKVAAHYACRTRNNQPGARISEHGKGRAIDISAFRMDNGKTYTVLRHWGSGTAGKALRRVHKGACGPFGTVLGPNSDRFHKDHFHFDTARYRSGTYCR